MFLTPGYAQNSNGAGVPAPSKNQTILRLLAENDTARERIAALEERERALTEEVKRADAATQAWRDAHDKALIELGETRATIKSLREAVAERERQVEELRSQRDGARAERDEARGEVKKVKGENRLLKLILIVEGIAQALGH